MLYRFIRMVALWMGGLALAPHPTKAVGDFTETTMMADTLIEHTVAREETLYGLARKYGVTVEEIRQRNPQVGTMIQVGEVLVMPVKEQKTSEEGIVHVVKPSETLYAIAQKYNVPIEQLKAWNHLKDHIVKVGQELFIKEREAQQEEERKQKGKQEKEQEVAETQGSKEITPEQPNPPPQLQPSKNSRRAKESGLASLLTQPATTNAFAALHRTVPIGNLIQVCNKKNGKRAFVRVVGRLEEPNDQELIIRISEAAIARLAPEESRFPVEISYIF